ncbi:MAG: type II secretion system protein [Candidatus Eremiobacteraeota bacterium]|nr:type II secretion system protein [Candidatus Eremiobacteraeota bacterium]
MTRSTGGFTLVEMIVVLMLFGIALGLLIPYYRNYSEVRAVEFWKDMIVSDLNRCRTLAQHEEKMWGIKITGESSYQYVCSADEAFLWAEPEKKIRRNLADSASRTFFIDVADGSVLSFSPAASVGDSADSQWAPLTARMNSLPAPFSIKIKCGKHERSIEVSRNSYCEGHE